MEFALHGQVMFVLRRVDDDVVRADAVHAVEYPAHAAVDLALVLQGRVLVRDAADPPPGAVRASILPIGEDFRRGHVLVAVTERALLRVRRRFPATERPGSLGARR